MAFRKWKRPFAATCLVFVFSTFLIACSSDDNVSVDGNDTDNSVPELTDSQISAADGQLQATLRTTTGGVPHILADNLESASFGSGYVQARDNVCILADAILGARGERARFYGPGPDVSEAAPIGINIVTDFSTRALRLVERAGAQFDQLSPASQAMIRGFVAGYNKYISETDAADLPGKCAGQPWVREITPQDLYAYYQLVTLFASGSNFTTGVTFFAAPPGANPAPMPATPAQQTTIMPGAAALARRATPSDLDLRTDYNTRDIASNGWGIGGDLTENGRGALLANPHFPYTGNRRLYQSQVTVPGVYDVNGAALLGILTPLIAFNDNIAWTHTVSTAQHFTLYQLQLAEGDNLSYIKDGEAQPITERTFTVEVANGTPTPTVLQKTFYYSEYGPMLAANLINPNLPAWGDGFAGRPSAFTYRDANTNAARIVVDQWLAMGRAQNLEQFQQPFRDCGSVLWVNTMYTDSSGRAFYIDGTSVPNLSEATLSAFRDRAAANPVVAGLAANGLTLLDGSTSRDDWVEGRCDGLVAYENMPRLERSDYVQNSNDSYWATNPAAPLDGFSPLFGPAPSILSPRTRMGLRMLENPADAGLSNVRPAGDDGLFTGEEIIQALYSNRAYYAETLLDELVTRCEAAGDTAITTGSESNRSVAGGCNALAGWDGVYDLESRGAHVFRVFIGHYDPAFPDEFAVAFDPDAPATTPGTPLPAPADPAQDPMLQALARGLDALDQVDIAYDAELGSVQQQQQSAGVPPADFPGQPSPAAPAGDPIPWHGNQNIEGGFNIVRPAIAAVDDGTRFPRVSPPATLADTGELSVIDGEGWRVAGGTSWHFGLSFTNDGPEAYGLVSYSQSDDPSSDHFSDQDLRYSAKNYRRLLYSQADIESDENLVVETISAETDGASRNDDQGEDDGG